MSKLKPVQSMSDLYRLCSKGEHQEQYKKLVECAALNLGMPENWGARPNLKGSDLHIEWLNVSAMETSEEGVVDEINFCLDLVK